MPRPLPLAAGSWEAGCGGADVDVDWPAEEVEGELSHDLAREAVSAAQRVETKTALAFCFK